MKDSTETNETSADFLARVGTDGMAWAVEMNKRFPSVSVDDLLGWCCNMIEAGREAGSHGKYDILSAMDVAIATIERLSPQHGPFNSAQGTLDACQKAIAKVRGTNA